MPYDWMSDFGGAYEDYSGGGGDTSWMSPTYQSPKKNPFDWDFSTYGGGPNVGVDYMSMPTYNSGPWQPTPQIAPTQQPYQAPVGLYDQETMAPKRDPYAGLFPGPNEPPKQPADPLTRQISFPTPVDFMKTEPTAPTAMAKEERDFPLLDRYAELAWNKPTREQNKGGKMNALMAGITGGLTGFSRGAAAGAAAGQAVRNAPYMRAMEDWKEQLAAGKDAATLERYQAETKRKEGYGNSLLQLRDRQAQAKYELDKNKYEAAGWVYKENATTGEAMRMNLRTGEKEDLGKVGLSLVEKTAQKGAEAGAVSDAQQKNKLAIQEVGITAADKRQSRDIATRFDIQNRSFVEGRASQQRGFGQQDYNRNQNFKLGELEKDLDQIRARNDPANVVSTREALDKTRIDYPELDAKFYDASGQPNFAAINAPENASDWVKWANRIRANTRKGVQPK